MQRPAEFFRALDPATSFVRPLIFFLVFSILGSMASTLSSMAAFGNVYEEFYGTGETLGVSNAAYLWFNFFLSPFVALVGLAINVGLTHLGVLLFVPTRKPIGVTARTYCYVAAPTVMALVPYLGWLVATGWVLVLSVIGIRWAHGTTTGRAAAAVLVPPLAVMAAIAGLTFFLLFLALALGGSV